MESTAQSPSADVNGVSGLFAGLVECVTPFLVFLLSFAYLCVFLRYSSLEPDEGILLQGAQRILDGQIPYRDFFSFYTPGSFYLLAGLFKAFGDTFMVARLSLAASGAVCSLLTYLLARRVCTRGFAVFAAALTTAAGVAYRFLVLHNWYSTLLACVALYCSVRLVESGKLTWAFGIGSFCALTATFEQSKGAGICLGLAIGFLALRIVGKKNVVGPRQLACFALGFLWPLILVFTYFGARHSIGIMVEDWIWPLRHYTSANHVAYGYQNWSDDARHLIFHTGPMWAKIVKVLAVSPGFLVPTLPLIAVGLLMYWMAPGRRGVAPVEKVQYYVLVCGGSAGLLVSVLMVRADIIHFMYLAPLWYVLLAWILGAKDFSSGILGAVRPYLVMLVALVFGLMSLVILTTATGAQNRITTRRGEIRISENDSVIEYVRSHTSPGDTILVYPYLPLYYYLTGTRSASPLDFFQPGMNTPEQAQEIVTSLEAKGANFVIFQPSFTEKVGTSWPGTSLGSLTKDPVSEYLARNYRVCKILNSSSESSFEVMVPREGQCPPSPV